MRVAWLSLVREEGVEGALEKLRPDHPQYFQLRQMLRGYRDARGQGRLAGDRGGRRR